jgi:dihydroorotate dehydrogenase (NAD+) catalytic subunit
MSVDLSVKLGRLSLSNPVLTASGTFGYGDEYQRCIDINKLGGIVTKTLTLKAKTGNKPVRIAETYCGMLNSIGLENIGLEAFIKEKLPKLKRIKTALIASIAGESAYEFAVLAKELAKAKKIKAL